VSVKFICADNNTEIQYVTIYANITITAASLYRFVYSYMYTSLQ